MPLDDLSCFTKDGEKLPPSSSQGEGRENRPYLKCTYATGMHYGEYMISFSTIKSNPEENPLIVKTDSGPVIRAAALENIMFVDRSNVTELTETSGIVRIHAIYKRDFIKMLVGISNIDGISRVYVPNSEVVWR